MPPVCIVRSSFRFCLVASFLASLSWGPSPCFITICIRNRSRLARLCSSCGTFAAPSCWLFSTYAISCSTSSFLPWKNSFCRSMSMPASADFFRSSSLTGRRAWVASRSSFSRRRRSFSSRIAFSCSSSARFEASKKKIILSCGITHILFDHVLNILVGFLELFEGFALG